MRRRGVRSYRSNDFSGDPVVIVICNSSQRLTTSRTIRRTMTMTKQKKRKKTTRQIVCRLNGAVEDEDFSGQQEHLFDW